MDLINTAKEMALVAILRGAIAVLSLVGRELALSEEERRAVLARVEAALPGRIGAAPR